jgi:hypothetical protein
MTAWHQSTLQLSIELKEISTGRASPARAWRSLRPLWQEMMPEACTAVGQQIKGRHARNPRGGLTSCATFQNRTSIGVHLWMRLFRQPIGRLSFDSSDVFSNEL